MGERQWFSNRLERRSGCFRTFGRTGRRRERGLGKQDKAVRVRDRIVRKRPHRQGFRFRNSSTASRDPQAD
jgi:hypothetical protein